MAGPNLILKHCVSETGVRSISASPSTSYEGEKKECECTITNATSNITGDPPMVDLPE
jgi:hypothetical protein